ncbi:MAG: TonB-dependent receptor, partial [Bacteroidaceae bacterium]|nr:TonB-dependent receptor [Bacteroidaceae bacterium]
GNAALSKNKIKDFDEYVETYDDSWNPLPMTVNHYNNSTLAFSPSTILNGFVNFHYKGFEGVWHTNFVSRQYLDNTENTDRSLPSYSVTNIYLNYTLNCQSEFIGIKESVFGLNLNNIFDRHYAASGWAYSAIVGSAHPNDNRYYQLGYVPMAGFTVMGSVTLRF